MKLWLRNLFCFTKIYKTYLPNKLLESIKYEKGSRFHREDGPAVICYFNDKISSEEYYIYGYHHRDDGPAVIEYYPSGIVQKEIWYYRGEIHRFNNPSIIHYNEDGSIDIELYYTGSLLHRSNGPAYIKYDENNNVSNTVYYNNNNLWSREQCMAYTLNILVKDRYEIVYENKSFKIFDMEYNLIDDCTEFELEDRIYDLIG